MGSHRDTSSRALLGTVDVILVASGRTDSCPSRVLSIAQPHVEDLTLESKRARVKVRLVLSFSNEDKVGTI